MSPSTDKSAATASDTDAAPAEPWLSLPDGRHFRPVKWQVPLETITRLSEERLPMINGRPGAQAERTARIAPAKFRL